MSAVQKWKEKQTAALAVHEADEPVTAQKSPALVVGLADKIKAAQIEGREARGENTPAKAQEIINGVVETYNERFFVAPEGSGSYVFEEAWDYELNRSALRRYRRAAWKEVRDNRLVLLPSGQTGQSTYKQVSEADIWLKSPLRRTFESIALIPSGECPPNTYNLWRGFGVEPKEGDVSQILSFIKSVICSGNNEHAGYLIRWLAYCVQYPDRQAGVVPVLQGGKGIGKSTIGRLMVRIFGQHGLQITNVRHLLGNFNAHLRSTLFLLADESFYAGDPQGGALLKGLVTEDYLSIEQKGVDVYQVRNRLKIMMCSNSEWVVPASSDERRYFCLTVSDKHQGDHGYWDSLNEFIDNGGAEAFLHYLLHLDLKDFNIRAVPQTEALAHQKLQSLDALPAFLFDGLSEGSLCGHPWGDEAAPKIPCSLFMERLTEYCQNHPRLRYHLPTARYVGLHLLEMAGATRGQQSGGTRSRCYRFPNLTEARETFAKWLRVPDFEWQVAE